MFKVLCNIFICFGVSCATASSAPVPVSAKKAPPISAVQIQYTARVRLLASDVRWALATLHLNWENYETLQKLIDKPLKDTDVAATREEQVRVKGRLLTAMKAVQSNARRLRSLTPVPRAWKRWDDKLIDASLDLEEGVSNLSVWLLNPFDEAKNAGARNLRRAQSTLEGVTKELTQRTDQAVARKVYVE